MYEKLTVLKEKLEALHTQLSELEFPQEDFINIGSYTYPFLSATDVSELPSVLARKIELLDKFVPSESDKIYIDNVIISLDQAGPNITHLNHSNTSVSSAAISSYFTSMLFISNEINNLFSFDKLKDKDLLPKKIINRLELYESAISTIDKKSGDIESKINAINEAYDAAENLPTTLKALRETNKEIQEIKKNLTTDKDSVSDLLKNANSTIDKLNENAQTTIKNRDDSVIETEKFLAEMKAKAETYIDKCEEAFRTTTSKGLAGAFEVKAKNLNASIRFWVAGLLFALSAGALVGFFRLTALESYLQNPNVTDARIFVQVVFSVLSVGAPLWFAWLATKQIGQRFRLAEDYEFKASVSKAYEGYRREAVNLDEHFQQRLFGNALTRLEEPPLRFVEESSHSSPFMEVLSSLKFKEFVSKGDDAVDSVLAKAGLKRSEVDKDKDKEVKIEVTKPVKDDDEVID